jgi:hypothetical protein
MDNSYIIKNKKGESLRKNLIEDRITIPTKINLKEGDLFQVRKRVKRDR